MTIEGMSEECVTALKKLVYDDAYLSRSLLIRRTNTDYQHVMVIALHPSITDSLDPDHTGNIKCEWSHEEGRVMLSRRDD